MWVVLGDTPGAQRGYCDGTVRAAHPPDFDEYHKHRTRQRKEALGDTQIAVLRNGAIPLSTRYVPVCRIHSRHRFKSGADFYANWDNSDRRKAQKHRFSASGVQGYYFGLTLDAAIDEAMHYGGGSLDPATKIILVLDCYFDNLLYLMHPLVIGDIWTKVGLPSMPYFEMYLTLMDPDTENRACNRIGKWALESGFDGLMYPSARYAQRDAIKAAMRDGKKPVPAVSFVPLGTAVGEGPVEPAGWFNNMLFAHMSAHGGPQEHAPIFAEPNLVLFSNSQLSAMDRAIFYWSFEIEEADRVRRADRRKGSKSYTHFVEDRDGRYTIVTASPGNFWKVTR